MSTLNFATESFYQHAILILKNYYGAVESLRAYLTHLHASPFWPPSDPSFLDPIDADQIHNLLANSYVCVNQVENISFRNFSATFDMREVQISYFIAYDFIQYDSDCGSSPRKTI